MFSYRKVTEKEAEESRSFPLLQDGEYNFEVLTAEFQMSNQGSNRDPNKPSNPMIKLKLVVWDNNGKENILFDYLLSTKEMGFKTRHFCYCVGLEDEYEQDIFNETMCEGRYGKALITTQKGKPKGDGTFYKDRNVIEDYLLPPKEQQDFNKKAKEFLNDDIGF